MKLRALPFLIKYMPFLAMYHKLTQALQCVSFSIFIPYTVRYIRTRIVNVEGLEWAILLNPQ